MPILEFIEELKESKTQTHLEHPEDLVFTEGTAGVETALNGLIEATKRESLVSVKFDGYPALIFGRNHDGQLVVADKHMFTKKDGTGRVTSFYDFLKYDQARGSDRSSLYPKLQILWALFEAVLPKNFRGYYWCDLLWTGQPPLKNGQFVFTPNTVTYSVAQSSALGKRIATSSAGIVIHQKFDDFDTLPQPITKQPNLNQVPELCIIWPFLSNRVNLKQPVQLISAVKTLTKQYGEGIDAMLNPTNLAALGIKDLGKLMKRYVNAGIRGDTRSFIDWLESAVSGSKFNKLANADTGYLIQHAEALNGIFSVFTAIANVKMNVIAQLDTRQTEIQQYVGNSPGGEGYVVALNGISLKLVNRAMFSAANFAKND